MAALPIPCPLTSDQFLAIYSEEEDGLRRFELFDGEVVERPMTNRIHDAIKNLVMLRISMHVEPTNSHLALVETTFKLESGVTFTPDVAIIETARWEAMREKFATGSPDIAIEVVSSDSANRLQFKIDNYLESGSKAVCCIYPDQRKITVFTQESRWLEYKGESALEFPSILPGFSLPLPVIFKSAQ